MIGQTQLSSRWIMLVYQGFIGQIDYNDKTQQFVGEVVNAHDLLEFSGKDVVEIKRNFQHSVNEYIAFQKNYLGKNALPMVGNFSVCLTTDQQSKVIQAAHNQGQSVSHWLNQQVDIYLNHYFNKKSA
jgi:predicted HicB family RNase H-like nuclease